jgi:phosphate transport system substrate-binding protein
MKKRSDKAQLLAIIAFAAIAATLMVSCKNKGTQEIRETPTSGNIRIDADESFRPIVDAEIATFTSLYTNAYITPLYKQERDIMVDFLNDSVVVAITAWTPTEEQKALLLESHIVVTTVPVAYDALALVLNKENTDSLLSFETVRDIFTGKTTSWNQISPKSKLGTINVIFDNNESCNIRYFKERFDLPDQLPSNFYAVKSNPEVIEYVSKTPGALGIVSVSWISDKDDSLSVSFTNKVQVAAVSQEYLEKGVFYRPEQGAIYNKSYAFVREMNMISRETFFGLGSGFMRFVTSEPGQRIILKSGLVPATMPIRLVQVKEE